jgi:hypothetical protein
MHRCSCRRRTGQSVAGQSSEALGKPKTEPIKERALLAQDGNHGQHVPVRAAGGNGSLKDGDGQGERRY